MIFEMQQVFCPSIFSIFDIQQGTDLLDMLKSGFIFPFWGAELLY
jgi:hypothetical protein